MTSHSFPLLALLPTGTGAGPGAGASGIVPGDQVEITSEVSPFLKKLSALPADGFALVSLEVEGVDERLLERMLGELAEPERLLLATSSPGLESAILGRRLGTGPVLHLPSDPEVLATELRRRSVPEDSVGFAGSTGERTTAEGADVEMVGHGAAMAEILQTVMEVADSTATVLITGESGTGKELVAQAVHRASRRRDRPFVPINCAAIPETLLESELFGHERGAFTGAVAQKEGRFERADGGTLFLDELGDMSLVLQAKLLRVLEDGMVERVGGEKAFPVDVRVVAATNRDLATRVSAGEFREDLYYRLAVARIQVPPLRERLDDLEPLALHFAAQFAHRYERPVEGIARRALQELARHPWPGNIRELRNVLDRAVLSCRGRWIHPEDLQLGVDAPTLSSRDDTPSAGYPPTLPLEEVERDHILRVLEHTGQVISDAAEILGIHRNTLARKLDRYGLRPEDAPE